MLLIVFKWICFFCRNNLNGNRSTFLKSMCPSWNWKGVSWEGDPLKPIQPKEIFRTLPLLSPRWEKNLGGFVLNLFTKRDRFPWNCLLSCPFLISGDLSHHSVSIQVFSKLVIPDFTQQVTSVQLFKAFTERNHHLDQIIPQSTKI